MQETRVSVYHCARCLMGREGILSLTLPGRRPTVIDVFSSLELVSAGCLRPKNSQSLIEALAERVGFGLHPAPDSLQVIHSTF